MKYKNLSKLSKMLKRKPLIVIGIFVIIFSLIVIAKTASFYTFLFHLFFDKGVNLTQASPTNLNILLLGIGGGSHEGPNLTDTIIVANVDGAKNKVTLTSIPRDLWVPDIEGTNKKINEAYNIGEIKRKGGGGLILAEAIVGKVTGQQIDYGIRIDFSGFVKAVDIVGGLDINVDNTLDDYVYPINGKENDKCGFTEEDIAAFSATVSAEVDKQEKFACRYKHLHFSKGLNHMTGEKSLEYVRSRHALGAENSDFARSKRQQKIISAFKDKILSAQTLINPGKIINLFNVLKGSIDTDIKPEEFDDFIRLAQKMKDAKIQSTVIDTGDVQTKRSGLLIEPPLSPTYNRLYVVIPRIGNGDFSEIKQYIQCEIDKGACSISTKPTGQLYTP